MKAMARDLVIFGEDWGGLPSSSQHLARELAKTRKILWINSIGLRRPQVTLHDIRRVWKKLLAPRAVSSVGKLSDENRNIRVMNVLTIPAPRRRVERRIATWLLALQIKPAMQAAGLVKPLLWTSLPTAVDACDRLDETGLVYYCGDDFSSLEGVDHEVVADREQELLARADLVIAASEKLAVSLRSRDTRLLPHGVDYNLFTTPSQKAVDFPDTDMPIAGFYGSISTWLDMELIEVVASRLPGWHFLFIGKSTVDTSRLSRFANITFLGERPHEQLPSYSQHWTVSMLPFVDNAQIRACNPLKLREYLAAGRPVVSTRFPAVEQYRDVVSVVDNADAMISALKHCAVAPPNPSQRNVVADHTWSARASELSDWLEAL
jgi:hypothetical protein